MRAKISLWLIWSLVAVASAVRSALPSFESGGYGQGQKYSAKDYLDKSFGDNRKNFFDGSKLFEGRHHGEQSHHDGSLLKNQKDFAGQGGYDQHHYNRGYYERNTGSGYEKAWGWDRIKIVKDIGGKKRQFGVQHGEEQELKKKQYGEQSKYGQGSHGEKSNFGRNDQSHYGKLRTERQKSGEHFQKSYKLKQDPLVYGNLGSGQSFEGQQGQGFGAQQGQGFADQQGQDFGGQQGQGFGGQQVRGSRGLQGQGLDGQQNQGFGGQQNQGFGGQQRQGFVGQQGQDFVGQQGQDLEGQKGQGLNGQQGQGFGDQQEQGFEGQQEQGFEGEKGQGLNGQQGQGFGDQQEQGFGGQQEQGFEGQQEQGFEGQQEQGFEGQQEQGFGGQQEQGFGGQQEQGFGGQQEQGFGGQKEQGFGGQKEQGFGGQKEQGFGGQKEQGFGGQKEQGFGGQKEQGFGGQKEQGFGGQQEQGFGGQQEQGFGGQQGQGFGGQQGQGFGGQQGQGFGGQQGQGLGGQQEQGFRGQQEQGFGGQQRKGSGAQRIFVAAEQNQGRYQGLGAFGDLDQGTYLNSETRSKRVKYNRKPSSPLNNYDDEAPVGEETSESRRGLSGSEYESRLKFKRDSTSRPNEETKYNEPELREDYASNLKYKRIDSSTESEKENQDSERRQDEPSEDDEDSTTTTEAVPKVLSLRRSRRPLGRKLTVRKSLYGVKNSIVKRYNSGLPGFGDKIERLLKIDQNSLRIKNDEISFYKRRNTGKNGKKKYHSGLDGFGDSVVQAISSKREPVTTNVPEPIRPRETSTTRSNVAAIAAESAPINVGGGSSSVLFPSTGNTVRG